MNYVKSPINYVGNKFRLLPQIIPLFPQNIDTYIDLFGGSGTVLLNVPAHHHIYNDINVYVAGVFRGICSTDSEELISDIRSISAEYGLDSTNKEAFERLRADYNKGRNDWLTLYTLMCSSFNGQFRFNNKHEYNSSFGKRCFNEKHIEHINQMPAFKKEIEVFNLPFNMIDLRKYRDTNTFVYCDPPYLNSTGNFNDGKRGFEGWNETHELTLLNLLDELNDMNVMFALSNNLQYNNPILNDWLSKSNYQIHHLIIDYGSCNHQKKNRTKGDEVLITNYENNKKRTH